MRDELTTTLTERGQVSVPSRIRKKAGLKTGQKLHWTSLSDTEFRVSVVEEKERVLGPFAMLGYARDKYHPEDNRTTDEIMTELREGEQDDNEL